jgi:filamentous hemagglutinin family protein
MRKLNAHAIALAVMSLAAVSASNAYAAGVVGSGGTQVNTAGAAPVVNINGANAQGVSRNTFSQFDVNSNGVVFNNLTAAGASQLAGQLQANANLNGKAARVIVADVNSAQASQLNGAMEVAGAPAHLLIANAAGISCNGCSTINAPVVTLAAARFAPRADSPLALEVDTSRTTPALLEIGEKGMDAGAGQLNLLSRATRINGAVKGWTVNSHTGVAFDGDAAGNFSGKLTDTAANAPAVALDVTELGGMYANKILLEGTERGLGVNNAGIIAAGQGGLGQELYGSNLSMPKDGAFVGVEGLGYRTSSAAGTAQAFDEQRKINRTMAAEIAVANGAAAMNALSDADKIAVVNGVQKRATDIVANMGGRPPAPPSAEQIAEWEAQARLEEEARAKARAEEQARMEADAKAREAAEAQARADWEARMAELNARAQAEAQARADWEAQMAADARAYEEAQAQARAQAEAQKAADAQERAQADAQGEAQARADWEAHQYEMNAVARAQAEIRAQAEAQAAAEAQARANAGVLATWQSATIN